MLVLKGVATQRTNINHITAPTSIEMERRIAGGAVLAIQLADEFVEAGLVRDMSALKLEDALSAQGVF